MRYNALSRHLREVFGSRVHRISLDAGFTCPNRDGTKGVGGCLYCDEEGSRADYCQPHLTITEQLRLGKTRLARRFAAHKFIAYFQPYTNTYAPIERLRALYDEALCDPEVVGLAIGTRPDCVADDILDLLGEYAARTYLWVEYGLQSARDETLSAINRQHSVQDFVNAVERTKQRGIRICAHVILGLPGESKTDMLASAQLLNELAIDGVKIHSLYISRNARIAADYQSGQIRLMTLPEFIDVVCDYLERLRPEIVIHRLVGEAPRTQLLAPDWCRNKTDVLRQIGLEMERRGTQQGARSPFSGARLGEF